MALGGITGAITGQKNGTTEHYKKGMPQHATPKSLSQALVGTFSSALESQWFALSGFQ